MAIQVIRTTSGIVKEQGNLAKLCGYDVTVVTATGAINLRDGGSAGTIRMVIPSGTAAGSHRNLATPMQFNDGIYAEFNGGATGTVGFLVE